MRQCGLEKAGVEETLNNTEQDLACWRFEALKCRCIILNREQLLEDNKIPFGTEMQSIHQQVRMMEAQQPRPMMPNARPTVLPVPAVHTDNENLNVSSCTPKSPINRRPLSTEHSIKATQVCTRAIKTESTKIESIEAPQMELAIADDVAERGQLNEMSMAPRSAETQSTKEPLKEISDRQHISVDVKLEQPQPKAGLRPVAIDTLIVPRTTSVKTDEQKCVQRAVVKTEECAAGQEHKLANTANIRRIFVKSKKPTIYPN